MSRKWQQRNCMHHGNCKNVHMSRKWQQVTCMRYGNYNNVRVCVTEMLDSFGVGSFSRSPPDCYNHMEEISLQFRWCYIKNFNARRIQKCYHVYPTAALSTANNAGNNLILCPALSQETAANLCLRSDVASLCCVSLESPSSPSTFYIAFAL
jgi:hypothetical protein